MGEASVEFTCPKCQEVFDADWDFGEEIKCPSCKILWETDYSYDYGGMSGDPWLESEVKNTLVR